MSKGKKLKNTKRDICSTKRKPECDKEETSLVEGSGDNLNVFFKNEEVQKLQTILAKKELVNVPVLLAAVILEKFNLVKRLLKDGHSIDDAGSTGSSPLMWSVRYNHVEMAGLLISRGASTRMTDARGDCALITAIKNPSWDESMFISTLWISPSNGNDVHLRRNAAGNTLLHFAARKGWSKLSSILINLGSNPNSRNAKGVTPLMVAIGRGGEESDALVHMFLEAKADVTIEDVRGCTALCYAISRLTEPINPILRHLATSVHNLVKYIQRRLELFNVTSPITTQHQRIISGILLPVIRFLIKHVEAGLEVLLELHVFKILRDALDTHIENVDYLNVLLRCLFELTQWCSCCAGSLKISKEILVKSFLQEGCADICVHILHKQPLLSPAVLLILFMICSIPTAYAWLQLHHNDLEPHYSEYMHLKSVSFNICIDEYHLKLLKKTMNKFHKLMIRLKSGENICESSGTSSLTLDLAKQSKFNSKRMRRKTKAWKARVAKIRSANIAERVTIKSDSSAHPAVTTLFECNSMKQSRENSKFSLEKNYEADSNQESDTSSESGKVKKIEKFVDEMIQYLRALFEDIVKQYETNWQQERNLGYPDFQGFTDEPDQDLYFGNRQEQIKKLGNALILLEHEHLTQLRNSFDDAIKNIKEALSNGHQKYSKILERIRWVLLNHRSCSEMNITNEDATESALPEKLWTQDIICGIRLAESSCSEEKLKEQQEKYIQQVIEICRKRKPSDLEKAAKARRKTEDHAYHLTSSIERLLDSSSESEGNDDHSFKELFPYLNPDVDRWKAKNHSQSDSNVFFQILSPSRTRRVKSIQNINQTNNQNSRNSMKNRNLTLSVTTEQYSSRWDVLVAALQKLNTENGSVTENGTVHVVNRDQRAHFIIARGGCFGDVELGLSGTGGFPLAVKSVARASAVGRILCAAVEPLLVLQHQQILPYVACETKTDSLFLAVPLCECNLGEHLARVRLTGDGGTDMRKLSQQLLLGLRFLHEQNPAVVHGNLKPSNVLVDHTGTLRLAEFGVYRALYHNAPPPTSSAIWLARETYEHYTRTSVMACTTYSDIQVAGMLVHFLITGGMHPFGTAAEEILENVQSGAAPKLGPGATLPESADMLTRMLASEPSARPSAAQALSHVFFWDDDIRWQVITACTNKGGRTNGTKSPQSTGNKSNDWPGAALQYLNKCVADRGVCSATCLPIDIRTYFLNSFPTLPLTLYRHLEVDFLPQLQN